MHGYGLLHQMLSINQENNSYIIITFVYVICTLSIKLIKVKDPVVVQELYDFSRNKLQQKVSQLFLVNRGVLYGILKV